MSERVRACGRVCGGGKDMQHLLSTSVLLHSRLPDAQVIATDNTCQVEKTRNWLTWSFAPTLSCMCSVVRLRRGCSEGKSVREGV